MSRDRYERRHRRTSRHPECVRVMAEAPMDVGLSLSEAMGAGDPAPPPRTIDYLRTRGTAPYHAVRLGEPAAVCGAAPVRGWGAYRYEGYRGDTVTCPRCRRKLGMGPLPAPRAEGGAR